MSFLDSLRTSLDIDRTTQAHAVMLGGMFQATEDLARCGVKKFTLIDYDGVERRNMSRHGFYGRDVGQAKVHVVASRLRQIDPEIEVDVLVRDFCELSRAEIDEHVGPADVVVAGTDFFPPMARVNVEVLRLRKPAVWVGIYRGGRAGEIVYYVPGLTPACYRCCCSARYQAFARSAPKVSSEGGTIFDVRLIDAIAGQITLGIVTRGAPNRFGRLIEQLGNRNFLQVKIDPDYRLNGKDVFAQHLGASPANFAWTTIALPMERDPDCPDCQQYHAQESVAT